MGGVAISMRCIHGEISQALNIIMVCIGITQFSMIINIINSLEFNIIHAFNLYSTVHLENCILLHFCYVALIQAIKVTRKGHAHVEYDF